jgi:hypothetical protein
MDWGFPTGIKEPFKNYVSSSAEKRHSIFVGHGARGKQCAQFSIFVETRVLNQAVRRNTERFPSDFMFTLTRDEIMRISQFVTSSELQFSKNATFALTFEEYVSKLWDSSPLLMKKAIDESMDVKNWILRIYMLSIGYPY